MKNLSTYLIYTSFIFLINMTSINSQSLPEINFNIEKQNVVEPKDQEIKVSIKLNAKNGDEDKYPVKFKLKNSKTGSAESEDYNFDESIEYQIDKDGGTTLAWVTINSDEKPEANETIVLEIEKSDDITRGKKTFHTIQINEVPNSELIRLTTGADFDFGVSDNSGVSFYGELNGFFPDLFAKKFGVSFKVFSNRYSLLDSSISTNQLNFIAGENIINNSDTLVPIEKIALAPTESSISKNYGLSFSPLYKLIGERKASLYLGARIEGMISNTNATLTYDTLFIRTDTISINNFKNLSENRLLRSSRSTNFISNFAISLPFRYIDENFEVRIIPAFGFTRVANKALNGVNINKQNFYYLDISVLDRNFGITIGGEIRNSFNSELPLVNIYIAKSFNFVNFAQF